MEKIAMSQPLNVAFSRIDDNLVKLKSAMIGLCADIDRYFKVAFDIKLGEEIDDYAHKRLLYIFPRFSALNTKQMNEFLLIFINIRNINAHLYLCRPIYISKDLKQFIYENTKPAYLIDVEGKITVYGAVLVLALMSQKYMIWPFCASFFRHEFFVEIKRGDAMSKFQIEQQKLFNSFCGIGVPLTQASEHISEIDMVYINDVLKRCLTQVFFDLEKVLLGLKSCRNKVQSFSLMLKKRSTFNDKLISRIITLRNCWFHGFFIGDVVMEEDGTRFDFNLEYVIDILSDLNEAAKRDMAAFGLISIDTHCFAQKIFNFYVLRLIEVSFKILDSRLLTEDKLDSRLDNMQKSYQRLEQVDPKLFDALAKLINNKKIEWSVGASKFLDKLPREFYSSNLKIAKIHCKTGFTIGKFKTTKTDIILALNKVDEQYKNLVNNQDSYEFSGTIERRYSKFITIINIEM